MRQASFLLPPDYVGRIHLSAELKMSTRKSVAWACEQPTNSDCSTSIGVKKMDDPGWRKSI